MKKTHDIAVKIGEYESGGQKKNRYKNIGAILTKGSGGFDDCMIFLDRSFNPAGVPFKEGSESIILSIFKVKDGKPQEAKPAVDDGDEIPF